jgi:hypothetical protein
MLGEGGTQGSPVASNQAPRVHPSAFTTVSSAPIPNSRLKSCASSPAVRPCRTGMGYIPTKVA